MKRESYVNVKLFFLGFFCFTLLLSCSKKTEIPIPDEAGLYIYNKVALVAVPLASLSKPGNPSILTQNDQLVSFSASVNKIFIFDATGYTGGTHASSYSKRYSVPADLTPLKFETGHYVSIRPKQGWKSGTYLVLDEQSISRYPLDRPARGHVITVQISEKDYEKQTETSELNKAGLYIKKKSDLVRVPFASLSEKGNPPILTQNDQLVSFSASVNKIFIFDASGYTGGTHASSYSKRYSVPADLTPLKFETGHYVSIRPKQGWKSGTYLVLDEQSMNSYPLDRPARGYVIAVKILMKKE